MCISVTKMVLVGALLLWVLNGCARSPVTQSECLKLGGDTTVQFRSGWKCCKIWHLAGTSWCEEVAR